ISIGPRPHPNPHPNTILKIIPSTPNWILPNPHHPPINSPTPTFILPNPNNVPIPTTPVPSNEVPSNEVPTAKPDTNIIPINPKPNNFLDALDIKPITPQQVEAFQDQITKKNDELAEDLKKLFPGNDQAIDQLVTSANSGRLDARSVQRFIVVLGGNLGLPLQLQANALIRQLIFNNLALKVLLNLNFNLLNGNINININIGNIGGGPLGGFWGFPQWPWNNPIWLGPGVWWGPGGFGNIPNYIPNVNGAAVLGLPYSVANPIPNYPGEFVASGILLMNTGESAVNYTLDGRRYTMEPGYQQVLARNRLTVAFDRGCSFGRTKYGIDDGWYKFTATDRGWELYKNTAKITLDNSDNSFSFGYVLNNRRQTLQPGLRQQLT
ncbi:hypothetical protein LCGC14_2930460, partial [marine sediment metagenome]